MFRHGFTLFLSLLVFLAFSIFLTYSKLQGVDQYVGALTLSQSIYVQTFIAVLQEQFASIGRALLVIFLILSPLVASFVSQKNRLFDLLIYLPLFGILAYLVLGYQAQISRELSATILVVWIAWFAYGVFIFLCSIGIICYRKIFKKQNRTAKAAHNKPTKKPKKA